MGDRDKTIYPGDFRKAPPKLIGLPTKPGTENHLDPIGAILWRIDAINDKDLPKVMKDTLKDMVLYVDDQYDKIAEALDQYEQEGNRFILRRLADHSDASEKVKRERRLSAQYVRLDVAQGIQGENNLNPEMTPRTLYNMMEQREATAREVFMKYDEDRSGTIDHNELSKLLSDLGFPPEFSEDAFNMIDNSQDNKIQFDEFVDFYNVLQRKLRGYVEEKPMTIEQMKQDKMVTDQSIGQRIAGDYQYRKIMRAADRFYGNNPPDFSKELVQEIEDYIMMLRETEIITQQMFERAIFLVRSKDKYTVFALYKFYTDDATNAVILRTYLQYKVDTTLRHERRATFKLEREQSFLKYKQEQKELLIEVRHKIRKEEEEMKRRELLFVPDEIVSSDESDSEEEEEVVKQRKSKRPRWLRLYEDKNWARKVKLKLKEKVEQRKNEETPKSTSRSKK